VPEIVRHLDTGDGDESDDARILRAFREKGRYLDANGFRHTLGTSVIVSHLNLGENPANARAMSSPVRFEPATL
jgi:hypothetical protein